MLAFALFSIFLRFGSMLLRCGIFPHLLSASLLEMIKVFFSSPAGAWLEENFFSVAKHEYQKSNLYRTLTAELRYYIYKEQQQPEYIDITEKLVKHQRVLSERFQIFEIFSIYFFFLLSMKIDDWRGAVNECERVEKTQG